MRISAIVPYIIMMVITVGGRMGLTEEDQKRPERQSWSFQGLTGSFDRAALQRGFQVYKAVCSACHGMKQLHYRNLEGIGFKPEEIKAIAAEYEVTDGPDDEGNMFQRKALPSDNFFAPYANEKAARAANNGALPPDLSLITKARPHGPNYVYALLTGYCPSPPGLEISHSLYYNPYFPGGQIAMAPPLSQGLVTYDDGTPATVEQMARDVITFLAWAAEPEMEARKKLGIKVLVYLIFMTGIFYLSMRKVWSNL